MLSLRGVSFIPESKHPVFDLVQMDPDGAALKAIHLAAGMYRLVWMEELEGKRPAYDTPDDAGLPSTRSAGLALVRSARAYGMHQHFVASLAQNAAVQANNPVTLYADDLLRGYRVDILRAGENVWRSLCQRVGWHLFLDSGTEIQLPDGVTAGQEVFDEGYVKAASTSSEDDGSSDLYLHETVFRLERLESGGPPAGQDDRGRGAHGARRHAALGKGRADDQHRRDRLSDADRIPGGPRHPAAAAIRPELPDAGAGGRSGGQQSARLGRRRPPRLGRGDLRPARTDRSAGGGAASGLYRGRVVGKAGDPQQL